MRTLLVCFSALIFHKVHSLKQRFCAMKASQLTIDIYLLLKRDEHYCMVLSIYNWYKILVFLLKCPVTCVFAVGKFWKIALVLGSVVKFGEVGCIWLGQGCTNRRHLGSWLLSEEHIKQVDLESVVQVRKQFSSGTKLQLCQAGVWMLWRYDMY